MSQGICHSVSSMFCLMLRHHERNRENSPCSRVRFTLHIPLDSWCGHLRTCFHESVITHVCACFADCKCLWKYRGCYLSFSARHKQPTHVCTCMTRTVTDIKPKVPNIQFYVVYIHLISLLASLVFLKIGTNHKVWAELPQQVSSAYQAELTFRIEIHAVCFQIKRWLYHQ